MTDQKEQRDTSAWERSFSNEPKIDEVKPLSVGRGVSVLAYHAPFEYSFDADDGRSFSKWYAKMMERVPPEYQATAQIECSYDDDHDRSLLYIGIEYIRPESEAETASRIAFEAREKEALRERELDVLARLLAKYPDEEHRRSRSI